jgi:Large eukaryotic DNA virus major capsid protein
MYVGIRPSNYNTTDPTLRKQALDKWYRFSSVTDSVRSTQGIRSANLSLKNGAYSVPASSFNNVSASSPSKNLRLTSTVTAVIGANNFDGINSGDIIVLPLTATNTSGGAVTQAVTLTLEVAQVVMDNTAVNGYIQFKQLVSDVRSLTGFAGLVSDTVLGSVTAQVYRADSTEIGATVKTYQSCIDSITITAHGIPIYNNFNKKFYNAYLPYHYGGPNISVPQDVGAMMIPFNIYCGSYQPSGHLNISRAREFYLSYTSSVIGFNSTVGTLIVSADAINFLLISDGSAVLRYST